MHSELRSTNTLSVDGDFDLNAPETELRFLDGRILVVPTAMLGPKLVATSSQAESLVDGDTMAIPLIEEQLQIDKRTVVTGKVRLDKSADTFEVAIDEPLAVSAWQVRRVPKNEVVLESPGTRQEGGTTIYPLLEERLVLTKELVLVEEIHVTHEMSERRYTETATLRRETLNVERDPIPKA